MASRAGANSDEVLAGVDLAKEEGREEDARYGEAVLADREKPKATVHGYEIVLGNPDAYPESAVKQQEDVALGRPNNPTAADELNVRGADSIAPQDGAAQDDAVQGAPGVVEAPAGSSKVSGAQSSAGSKAAAPKAGDNK